MEKTLERISFEPVHNPADNFMRGLKWGFLGGLAGTLVMDLLLMGSLLVLKQPATLCFSIVGDTVSSFLAILHIHASGAVQVGIVTHYVVGPLFGILFGIVVAGLPALRRGSFKKTMLAAFIYVEVLSQPLLALTPFLLKMDRAAILEWFAGSFVMHLILSQVLGLITWYGSRPATRSSQRCKK